MTRFARPLRVELGRSRRLIAAAAAVHALAATACLLAGLPLPVRLLGAGLAGLHGLYCIRRHAAGRSRRALRALAWDATRGWQVHAREGGWQRARLLVPVFVSVPLVIVRMRTDSGRLRSALVVADRLPADDFRRLRVRLLQTAHAGREP